MAVNAAARKDFENLSNLPWGKAACILKAAYKLYECETGGGGNCLPTFVNEVEACLHGGAQAAPPKP